MLYQHKVICMRSILPLLLLASLGVRAQAAIACNTLSFDTPQAYPFAQAPVEIYTVDFDGDGRLDLGVASYESFTIRYGLGDGTLSEPVTIPMEGIVLGVADVTGDALPDLVEIPHVIRENRGGREFPIAGTSSAIERQPVLGDFTGDGRADVLAPGPAGYTLLTFSNGALTTAATTAAGDFRRELQAADFNGDGRLDVIARHQLHPDYAIYQGDGQGRFSLQSVLDPKVVFAALVTPDLDRDGRADLVTSVYEGGVYKGLQIFYGNGTKGQAELPEGAEVRHFVTHDLDRDGDLDVVAGLHFGAPTQVYRNDHGVLVRLAQEIVLTPVAGAGDYTGDGVPDLVVSTSLAFGILRGIGNGAFDAPRSHALPPVQNIRAVVWDIDGNGLDELVYINAQRALVARPNGFGGFAVEMLPPVAGGAALVAAANGEVAVAGSTGVSVFRRGANGWTLNRFFEAPELEDMVLTDLTGDGINDVATVTRIGDARSLLVFLSTITRGPLLNDPLPPNQFAYDLNARGRELILTLSGTLKTTFGDPPFADIEPNGRVTVYTFNSNGATVTQRTALANDVYLDTVVGDFNGDGNTDILASNWIAYGALGTFAPRQPFDAGSNVQDRRAADLDGDGITDLLINRYGSFLWYRGSAGGLQRVAGEWMGVFETAPVIARVRPGRPPSILFSRHSMTEIEAECVKAPGKRRGARR
jgi:FG-GAP-like repeat